MLWGFNSRAVYRSIGITEHMYHVVAISFGLPAGVASIIGLIILTYRRVTVKRIIATSTKGDYIALILLLIVCWQDFPQHF